MKKFSKLMSIALLSIFTVLSSVVFSTGGEDENSPNYNPFHRHISFEKAISFEGNLLIFVNREVNRDKINFYINILKRVCFLNMEDLLKGVLI